jgi:hypothetical protein
MWSVCSETCKETLGADRPWPSAGMEPTRSEGIGFFKCYHRLAPARGINLPIVWFRFKCIINVFVKVKIKMSPEHECYSVHKLNLL